MPFCDGDVVVDDHDHPHDDDAAADDGDGVSAAGAIGDDSEDTKANLFPIGGLNRKI